jgi:hypothetical protein
MPTIKVEFTADVKARAEVLWDILVDVKSWPVVRLVTKIDSPASNLMKEGSSFVAQHQGLKWTLTVGRVERPNKVRWIGRRLGLKAVHEWEFIEEGAKTRAVNRESISGWLTIFLYPLIKRMLARGDEEWLNDLVSRAEES